MANNSKKLSMARKAKNDEFYTQLSDIEKELRHYKEYFRDKVIFCNCDDPETSNFWKYFELNFTQLRLKKLIATHYETKKPSYKLELVRDVNGDGNIDRLDIIKTGLKQNGDFRSPECVDLLKEADIVVTNPPFSLFREYIAQLMEYDKKFIIIGNLNAITYKETFPLLKENKMWLGYGFKSGNAYFYVSPNIGEQFVRGVYDKATGLVKFRNVVWYTNIDIQKRHEDLILYRNYSDNDYPLYDNYDAIEVSKIADIPCDYYEVMGVPITFLDKYNPDQFEVVGITTNDKNNLWGVKIRTYTPNDAKNYSILNAASVLLKDGKLKAMYARVLIRRKQGEAQ